MKSFVIAGILAVGMASSVMAAPRTEVSFSAGLAQNELRSFREENRTPMGELRVALLGKDVSLTTAVRYGFDGGSAFARDKSRVKMNLDVPITETVGFFTEVEKAYLTGNDWGWAGLKFTLK